jgi:uncharacterized phiE125 gp8 family phage protein
MWSAAETVTPAAAPAIALAEIKEFVRVDEDADDFDAQLTGFAAAAVDHIEKICSIRLAPQSVQMFADEWGDLAWLPIGPVTHLESIHFLDRDGVEQLLDGATYELTGAGLARGVRPSAGSAWPTGLRAVTGAIRVTATAGYVAVPPTLRAAALTLAADLFAFRESAVVGTVSAKIAVSATVEDWLTNYRIWL